MREKMDQQGFVSINVWFLSIPKRRTCISKKGKLKISHDFITMLLQTKFNLFSSSTENASDRFIYRVAMEVERLITKVTLQLT